MCELNDTSEKICFKFALQSSEHNVQFGSFSYLKKKKMYMITYLLLFLSSPEKYQFSQTTAVNETVMK